MNSKKTKKTYLTKEDLDPRNVKIRVTAMIDEDILDALREQAKTQGMKYQTLLNQKLRESVLGEAVVKADEIKARLDEIKALLKKRA